MTDTRRRNRVLGWLGGAVALSLLALWWSDARASSERVSPISEAEPFARAQDALVGAEERSAVERAAVPPEAEEDEAPAATDAFAEPTAAEPTADEPCLLLGSVRDTRGFPVELDRLEILVRAPRSRDAVPVEELGPGRFCVRGSNEGSWSVRTRSPDYFDWRESVHVEPGGGPYELDIVLEPCLGLDVFLTTASGEPLVDAARQLLGETHFFRVRVGRTCSEASAWTADFDIDRDLPGQPVRLGFLRVEEPENGSSCLQLQVGSRLVDTRTVVAGADSVTFVLEDAGESLAPASIRGRLVGELSGEAPKWANVELYVAGISVWPTLNNRNAEGIFEADELPPGRITITLRASGHGRRKLDLVLEPGEHRDLGEVALPELSPLRVSVVTAGGSPVSGARISTFPTPWAPDFSSSYQYATEDDPALPGKYTIQPETEQLALRATHGTTCSRVVRARQGDDVVLVLETSAFEAPLALRGIEGSTWWLVEPGGLPVAQGWVPTSRAASVTVLPGTYTVHVVTPEEDASSFPVTFEAP